MLRNSIGFASRAVALTKVFENLSLKTRAIGTLIKLNPSKLPTKYPGEFHEAAVARTATKAVVDTPTPIYTAPAFFTAPQVEVKSIITGETTSTLELSPFLFACTPRKDILHRMVVWQLAKRRQGTHKTKDRWEVSYSTRKIYQQKGTGRARHGDRGAPIFRGGGHAKPIRPRDYTFKLNKQVRQLALRMALTTKLQQNRLTIVDSIESENVHKTKTVSQLLTTLGVNEQGGALVIDVNALGSSFERGAANIHYVDVLPLKGLNVYDMLRREKLILTKGAVEALSKLNSLKN